MAVVLACVALSSPAPDAIELRLPNVTLHVRTGADLYACVSFDLSARAGGGATGQPQAYVDRIGPLFSPIEHEPYIHHITVYSCTEGARFPVRLGEHFPCILGNGGGIWPGCEQMVYVWNRGPDFRMPEGTGLQMPKLALLQVHFKNPAADSPLASLERSSAGMAMHVAPAGVSAYGLFELGPRWGMLAVPPRTPQYKVPSICAAGCIERALDEAQLPYMEILAINHHMHLLGRQASTEIVRRDGSAQLLALDDPFDMHHSPFAAMRFLPAPARVYRGEHLQYTCVYNSSQRETTTILGVKFTDEMCYSYMIARPALPSFSACWHANDKLRLRKGAARCMAICNSTIPNIGRAGRGGRLAEFVMPRGPHAAARTPEGYASGVPETDVCQPDAAS
jgi:hypothetical protein